MLKKNFTRKELTNKIHQNLGFSKNFSFTIIDDFFESVISELIRKNKVKISSFGTFIVSKKKERINIIGNDENEIANNQYFVNALGGVYDDAKFASYFPYLLQWKN